MLAAGELMLGIVRSVFTITQISLRQAVTPDHQQGRMNASIPFVMWVGVPIGALLAGWLGASVGLLPAVWVGISGTFAAALWIFVSPIRGLRAPPTAAHDALSTREPPAS